MKPPADSVAAHGEVLIRRLRSICDLADSDAQLINALPITIKTLDADCDIVRQGDAPNHTCLIIDGLAAMYKITGPGRRQILNFYVPGDVPDLHSLHMEVMDSSIVSLTPCTLGFLPHSAVREVCKASVAVRDALWKMTLIDSAVFREWIVNIGQRDALVRLAHLLCEVFTRLRAVQLADPDHCDFPITQQELADATGISVVHVNRMLQELRGQGLITLRHRKLHVFDWDGLKRAGDFDPVYLQLSR